MTIDNTGGGSATVTAGYDGGNTLSLNYLNVGYNGEGDFEHYASNVTVNDTLILGNFGGSSGTYNLYADDSTLTIGSGGLEIVGNYGTGTFNNYVGYYTYSDNSCGGELIIGNGSTGNGTYNLGGELSSAGTQIVGSYGVGALNENTYGANSVGLELDIAQYAGSRGSYSLSGTSNLTVNGSGLYVGGSSAGAGGTGTLTVGAGCSVTVAGILQVYPGASNSVALNG